MLNIADELKKLPDQSGVYIMKNQMDQVIYVGKAINLKNRVRQYFQSSSNHALKVKAMVSNIDHFEYIVTDSELEALMLECTLIKKHKPKYNVLLKDDKSYPYIKVTMNEPFPRILSTRRVEKDGAKYFGPYTRHFAVNETLALLKKLFPIKSCNKVLPRDAGKTRPCLNYHLYQCLAPCQGNVNQTEYRGLMQDICNFISGKQDDIIKRLEEQMLTAAEKMEFERAADLRNKISSIHHILGKQKVISASLEDQDVVGFARSETDACVQIFFIRSGKLIGRESFIFENVGDTDSQELLSSFIKQFYSLATFIPKEIILQEDIEDAEIIGQWLKEKRDSKVHIKVPQKGEKHHLVEMVEQNAQIALNHFQDKIRKENKVAEEGLNGLKELLMLEKIPFRIEAYDISNTGTTEVVASMVVFHQGLPENREYKRFKIKSLEEQNDYKAMQEVLFRRLKRCKEEQSDESIENGFGKIPDLIFVDGGLGHVNAAHEVLVELGFNIPLYGMVKNASHRTRGLVTSKKEYDLSKNMSVLRMVTAIQDEAHRFALTYNRKLRDKRHTTSILDDIQGVGPSRRKKLILHFGSVSKIKNASVEALKEVEGISEAVAKTIYDYFRA